MFKVIFSHGWKRIREVRFDGCAEDVGVGFTLLKIQVGTVVTDEPPGVDPFTYFIFLALCNFGVEFQWKTPPPTSRLLHSPGGAAVTRAEFNEDQRARRADLRARGICVDCQKNKAHVDEKGKRHVCCDGCLAARRDRWRNGSKPPLLKLIEKAEAAS